MIDRRDLLRASAALIVPASPAAADEDAAADLRRLVDRLAGRSRVTRPFLLRRFHAERLSAEERILYETLLSGADADAALARRDWGRNGAPYPVTHRSGAWRRAIEFRPGDRIRHAVRAVNQDTNQIEAYARRGISPPDFLVEATLPALRDAVARVQARDVADGETLVEAISHQANVLQQQRAAAPAAAGVCDLPDGEDFYAQTLHFQYGAPVDARDAHARALAHCRELQSDADRMLRLQGLTRGSVAERLRAFAADERYAIRDKQAAVATMNAQLERMRALLHGILETPAGEVRRLAPAASAHGQRSQRAGLNYDVDLETRRPAWSLASAVHHEHTPGHILQARFNRDVPALQLRYSGGYGEGWAIYAETLADELGAFEGDTPARIGYLQWMLFRFARVVGDTGMHAMGWSRERTIAEMYELQGESVSFVSIEDDVTRFAAQPGLFAAQGLAALHLMHLRERTRRAARARFSLKDFHDAALRSGPLSPPGLEQAMQAKFAL